MRCYPRRYTGQRLTGYIILTVALAFAFVFSLYGSRGPGVDAATARGAATPDATPQASPAATPVARVVSVTDKVTIKLTDAGFSPSVVQATNGHDLTITLVNTGTRQHAFQIAALKVDVSLAPGAQQTITINSPSLGDYTFVSDAPGDEHWSGTLIFYI